jgi:hypothetical protein
LTDPRLCRGKIDKPGGNSVLFRDDGNTYGIIKYIAEDDCLYIRSILIAHQISQGGVQGTEAVAGYFHISKRHINV